MPDRRPICGKFKARQVVKERPCRGRKMDRVFGEMKNTGAVGIRFFRRFARRNWKTGFEQREEMEERRSYRDYPGAPRKYRCNRILEDRKISRRLCAPFFPCPFGRRSAEASARSTPDTSASSAPLEKVYFGRRRMRVSGIPRVFPPRHALAAEIGRFPWPRRDAQRRTAIDDRGIVAAEMQFRSTACNGRRIPRVIVHMVSGPVRRHT